METKEIDTVIIDEYINNCVCVSPIIDEPDYSYDSERDTLEHIELVEDLIHGVVDQLDIRAREHDISKLLKDEKPTFDRYTSLLEGVTYGSAEYMHHLQRMKPALDSHYASNRHHPQHHKEGIHGMNLIDLVEMLCDWKAASSRHADGNIMKSLVVNKKRFNYGEELNQLFLNTVKDLKWE